MQYSDDDFEDAEEGRWEHKHAEEEEEEEEGDSGEDMRVDEQPAPSNVAIEFAVQGRGDHAHKPKVNKSPRRVRFTAQDKVRVVLYSSTVTV